MQEMQEMQVSSLSQEDALEKEMAATSVFLLKNSMGRGAWSVIVQRVTKSDTTENICSLGKKCWWAYLRR